ncbi:MAG: OadG family transporter subunit [Candidatus Fimenecus sp.]
MDILQQLKYEDGITIGEALNVSVTGFVVVLLILALLAVLVLLLSKAVRAVESKTKKKASPAPKSAQPESAPAKATAAQTGTPLPETFSAGQLDLYDVDEKTAAVIMAIVSHESGIPLNRLQFKSIKAIEK